MTNKYGRELTSELIEKLNLLLENNVNSSILIEQIFENENYIMDGHTHNWLKKYKDKMEYYQTDIGDLISFYIRTFLDGD